MNVGELRKVIENMPDDAEMFSDLTGHELIKAYASDWKCCYNRVSKSYWQFFDDEAVLDDEIVVRALIIE